MAAGTQRLLDSDDGVDRGCDLKGIFWTYLPGFLGAVATLVVLGPVFYWITDNSKNPEYSVAVAGFSGLDPDRDLPHATLDPEFDLTLRIKVPRRWSAECIETGTVAYVSYGGVALAQGPVPVICARSEAVTEVRSVLAWGHAVPVPKFARHRLAEELRRGEAAVHVKLKSRFYGRDFDCRLSA